MMRQDKLREYADDPQTTHTTRLATKRESRHPREKCARYGFDADHSHRQVTDWLNRQTVYTYNNAGYLTKPSCR